MKMTYDTDTADSKGALTIYCACSGWMPLDKGQLRSPPWCYERNHGAEKFSSASWCNQVLISL